MTSKDWSRQPAMCKRTEKFSLLLRNTLRFRSTLRFSVKCLILGSRIIVAMPIVPQMSSLSQTKLFYLLLINNCMLFHLLENKLGFKMLFFNEKIYILKILVFMRKLRAHINKIINTGFPHFLYKTL